MTRRIWIKLTGLLAVTIFLQGCVSAKPVEMEGAVDDRPLLLFISEGSQVSASGLTIYVDDLYMGDLQDYIGKKKGLIVLPGTHFVEIRRGNAALLERKIYVGSGGSKTIPISID